MVGSILSRKSEGSMGKIFQSTVLILLTLITLKLYPEIGAFTSLVSWVLLAVLLVGGSLILCLWLVGVMGDWIKNGPARAEKRREMKEISKTLKSMDNMKKWK